MLSSFINLFIIYQHVSISMFTCTDFCQCAYTIHVCKVLLNLTEKTVSFKSLHGRNFPVEQNIEDSHQSFKLDRNFIQNKLGLTDWGVY